MIPLKFKDDVCPEFYKEFASDFEHKIKKYKCNGYIGKGKKKEELSSQTKDFLDYLLAKSDKDSKKSNLWELLDCPANELKIYADNLCKLYTSLKKKDSKFFNQLKKNFVDNTYTSSFRKDYFIKSLDIKVCPYCNRSFIECIDKKDKTTPIKGQIDHFYSKEKYPFLALSRFNLIPCCSDCNGVGGKFTADADETELINPYLLKDTNGMKFKMEITKSSFANIEECASSIKILVEETNQSGLEQNIKTFHLQEIYQSHSDVAAEIYLKGKLKMPSTYRQKIINIMKPIMPITEHDFNQLILEIEDNPQQFKNKSLSKFKADLAKDEMLI